MAAAAGFDKLDLSRLGIIRRLGFEDGSACFTPPPISDADVDLHRTLFVHDAATLSAGNFSLRRTLQKLATDVSAHVVTTPEAIFRQFMDTQNDTPNQVTAGDPLCSDANGKVNGYPFNKCPRAEGGEAVGTVANVAGRIDNDYHVLALVNRIDLADKGWKSCGEHRIVYGKNLGIQKELIIFEAVLPNPKPGCRSGCRPVIDFWRDLSTDANPASRAAKLESFYYNGLSGFQPVVLTTHYTSGTSSVYGGSGSGQIRTNQFLDGTGGQGPWTLKEFKTLLSCAGGSCNYDILPNSAKVNPYGVLWSRDVATGVIPPLPSANGYATTIAGLPALANAFQADVLAQVTAAKLAAVDPNAASYEVKPDKNAAESQSQGPLIDHYLNQFKTSAAPQFRNDLDTLAAPFGLTGEQIVNRAAANSCAGCHRPPEFGLTLPSSIGPGMSWPDALLFVHVDTAQVSLVGQPGFDLTKFGGNPNGSNISPALLNVFLPARRTTLVGLANKDVCDCVPKLPILTPKKQLQAKQKLIIEDAERKLKAELGSARERLGDKPAAERLLEQKELLGKAETARDTELDKAGLKLAPIPTKPEPVILSKKKLAADQLRKAKIEKLQEIVNAEPARETITGSFRSE